eukprot:CAMPEP_0202712892 /NCGR_PEP_ID=MMETSP1385-20130828/47553_1 /ASSEMBLY_ACC=CAM_ASM_000861 /TAXON_ID=933848 /ORGANISM="Elphidium margaritaceum" /LENGTH=260 /DNA_ID=CAMNT_0049373083 /DNA_START=26 /DNA_END=805 /DNA_ORIENTATION=-
MAEKKESKEDDDRMNASFIDEVASHTRAWDNLSFRKPDNLNERWTFFFRYVCGTLGISSSVLATYLIYAWFKMPKVGGLSWRTPQKAIHPKGYINSHGLAMTVAFCLCMAPSMTAFEMMPLERHTNKDVHNYLNCTALLASIAGLGMAIDFNRGTPVKSVHAVVGYSAMTLMVLNFLGGFTMYVMGKGGALKGSLKPLHKRAGFFACIAGLMNILIALQYKQSQTSYDAETRKALHRIAYVVIFAMFNVYCCVNKFSDKL